MLQCAAVCYSVLQCAGGRNSQNQNQRTQSMYIFTYTHIYMYVHTAAHRNTPQQTATHVHIYTHNLCIYSTYIHVCVHINMCAYIHTKRKYHISLNTSRRAIKRVLFSLIFWFLSVRTRFIYMYTNKDIRV